MNEQEAKEWLHKAFATGNKILIQKALTHFHNKYRKVRPDEDKKDVRQGSNLSLYEEAKEIFSDKST